MLTALENQFHSRTLTFRNVSIFVAVLTALSIVFQILLKFGVVAPPAMHHPEWDLSRSPVFIVCYNIFVGLGFWIIHTMRNKAEYYKIRVFVYGMLLGGIAGELLNFFGREVLHVF